MDKRREKERQDKTKVGKTRESTNSSAEQKLELNEK
jgi:hypothetical protein